MRSDSDITAALAGAAFFGCNTSDAVDRILHTIREPRWGKYCEPHWTDIIPYALRCNWHHLDMQAKLVAYLVARESEQYLDEPSHGINGTNDTLPQ